MSLLWWLWLAVVLLRLSALLLCRWHLLLVVGGTYCTALSLRPSSPYHRLHPLSSVPDLGGVLGSECSLARVRCL